MGEKKKNAQNTWQNKSVFCFGVIAFLDTELG